MGAGYTIVYDADGVKLDSLPKYMDWFAHIARVTQTINPFDTVEKMRASVDAGYSVLYEKMGLDFSDSKTNQIIWREFDSFYGSYVAPLFPSVSEQVLELAKEGFAQAIFTSNNEHSVLNSLKTGGIDEIIHPLIGANTTGRNRRKPDPHGLLLAMKQLGATPSRTVYIGDTPSDMEAARNAGLELGESIKVIAVTYGWASEERMRSQEADAFVDSPDKLADAIEQVFIGK